MKKLFLSTVAVILAIAAGAQNKNIDRLVDRYADMDGFTVLNLNGEAIDALGLMIPRTEGTITLDDGTTHNLAQMLEQIVSVKAVVTKNGDNPAFAQEARSAIDSKGYTPIVSHNADDGSAKLAGKEIRRGKFRGNKEIVLFFSKDGNIIIGSVIGKIDMEMVAKIVSSMQK